MVPGGAVTPGVHEIAVALLAGRLPADEEDARERARHAIRMAEVVHAMLTEVPEVREEVRREPRCATEVPVCLPVVQARVQASAPVREDGQ